MENYKKLESFPLLEQFHEFYSAFLEQKENVDHYGGGSNLAPVIRSELLSVLKRQEDEARRLGGEYGFRFYKEAQYIMAALADDLLINMDWPGKEEWKSNLLEFALFESYEAGEQFFHNLDNLLVGGKQPPLDLATLYFLALSLGFKGKLRDEEYQPRLKQYRKNIFTFVFQQPPKLPEKARGLFPQAYGHLLTRKDPGKLPYLERWIAVMASIVIIFLTVSHFFWSHLTSDITRIAEAILYSTHF